MTRWKRELSDLAVERGYLFVYFPRNISRESFAASKVLMALAEEHMRDPAVQRRLKAAARADMEFLL